MLGLGRQRRLEHGHVAEVAGARGLGDERQLRRRGHPDGGLIARRLGLLLLHRAAGGGGAQDPAGEALAAAAADVRHALAQAAVQRQEERRVNERVHVRDVQRHLRTEPRGRRGVKEVGGGPRAFTV